MKKSFVVLLSALFFSACEKEVEEPAGKWGPMEWEKNNVYQSDGQPKWNLLQCSN